MINYEAQMLETERKTVGWFHLIWFIFTIGSVGGALLGWIIHGMVVASFNSALDRRIALTNVYYSSTNKEVK